MDVQAPTNNSEHTEDNNISESQNQEQPPRIEQGTNDEQQKRVTLAVVTPVGKESSFARSILTRMTHIGGGEPRTFTPGGLSFVEVLSQSIQRTGAISAIRDGGKRIVQSISKGNG